MVCRIPAVVGVVPADTLRPVRTITPDPVPVPRTCHTALATVSPICQQSSRPLPVSELFPGQGGYWTALEDIDHHIFDSTYWPINISWVQASNEYRGTSVDTYISYSRLNCERLAQIPT